MYADLAAEVGSAYDVEALLSGSPKGDDTGRRAREDLILLDSEDEALAQHHPPAFRRLLSANMYERDLVHPSSPSMVRIWENMGEGRHVCHEQTLRKVR